MMIKSISKIGIVLAAVMTPSMAAAQEPLTIQTDPFAVISVKEGGKTVEKLVPGGAAAPGDVLMYRYTITNNLKQNIPDLKLTREVSPATTFISEECSVKSQTKFSMDPLKVDSKNNIIDLDFSKMKFASAPLKRTIMVTENGKSVQKTVEVKPSEYTALEWSVPVVPAKQSIICSYRVKVK